MDEMRIITKVYLENMKRRGHLGGRDEKGKAIPVTSYEGP
jgi:hypothetical protein